MKILFILALFFASCGNESSQKQVYKDSAVYFSKKLADLTDSGYSKNDSIRVMQETRKTIYTAMRQYYLDNSK